MPYSYATERKIRIIEEKLGPTWKEQRVGQSIDAVYNDLVGDTRKNLFCKINASVKDRLDEMTSAYRTGMAEFIEHLIEAEYARHEQRTAQGQRIILSEFSGS